MWWPMLILWLTTTNVCKKKKMVKKKKKYILNFRCFVFQKSELNWKNVIHVTVCSCLLKRYFTTGNMNKIEPSMLEKEANILLIGNMTRANRDQLPVVFPFAQK